MYLKRVKRKATVIYVTFALMIGIVGWFGLFQNNQICFVLFFWWLLLAFLLISQQGSQMLLKLEIRKDILRDQGEEYKPPYADLIRVALMIGAPFYYYWFLITFLAYMNVLFFLMLQLPVLTLSGFAMAHAAPSWHYLGARRWSFWMIHLGMFGLTQLFGWIVRNTLLIQFYAI